MRFDASGCLGFRSVLSGRSSGPSDTEKLEGGKTSDRDCYVCCQLDSICCDTLESLIVSFFFIDLQSPVTMRSVSSRSKGI